MTEIGNLTGGEDGNDGDNPFVFFFTKVEQFQKEAIGKCKLIFGES